MNEADARGLARGWIEAWMHMDIDWLRSHLAEAFVHTSPFGRLVGRDHYLETVEPMAHKSVMDLRILAVTGDAAQAAVWFENVTAGGAIPTCDWVRASAGRIDAIQSFYDSALVRDVLTDGEQSRLSDDGS